MKDASASTHATAGRPAGRTALQAVDAASAAAIIVLMAVMVVTVSSQVVLRYVLNASIDWADELARVAFVWVIFLAVPHALAAGRHIGIDFLTSRLPAATARRVQRGTALLSAALFALVAVQAGIASYDNRDQHLTTLPGGVWLMYLPVALGSVHGLLHLLRLAAKGSLPVESSHE